MSALDFSDLEEDLGNFVKPGKPVVVSQPCIKCAGRGTKTYGYVNIKTYPCSTCKGTGKVTAARLNRIAGFKKGEATRATKLADKRAEFRTKFPEVVAWVSRASSSNNFAQSLMSSLESYGSLTDNQVAAVRRSIVKLEEVKAASAIDLGNDGIKLIDALKKAVVAGKGKPKILTEKFTFSLAPATGNNAGYAYVVAGGDYVGKIDPTGKLHGFKVSAEMKADLMEVLENPLEAAVKYGRLTGRCSCCGRRLDNKISIDLGIGPICRAKFF